MAPELAFPQTLHLSQGQLPSPIFGHSAIQWRFTVGTEKGNIGPYKIMIIGRARFAPNVRFHMSSCRVGQWVGTTDQAHSCASAAIPPLPATSAQALCPGPEPLTKQDSRAPEGQLRAVASEITGQQQEYIIWDVWNRDLSFTEYSTIAKENFFLTLAYLQGFCGTTFVLCCLPPFPLQRGGFASDL